MKKALIYILSILSLGMISSCAQDDPIEVAKNNRIVFVAEPTPYEGDGLPTKADVDYEKISSLYLLLFDKEGIVVGAPIDMNSKTEYAYIHEQESDPNMTAFFLANFTSNFVNSLTDLEDVGVLSGLVASKVVNNCIKPANDAITGIPMIGKLSITQKDLGQIIKIPLKRLFAKVDVRVVMGTSGQSFVLESCTLTNLPQEVRISESDTWVAQSFNNPITLTDGITKTNEGYYLPTIYVPEHKPGISGTGPEQDKISASGYPLYLTLKGIYRRDDNWSARVEYTIYLGGDNNTNFDLLRNHSYANVIEIKGVNSATTDKRVNYYGHNLANPTNSGEDDPANCYIISEPGRYMIPACKGNVLSAALEGNNFAVLANDNSSSNSITNIQKVNFNGNDYIRFDVNLKNGTSTAVSDGNLVFQYGDWSWHLWFAPEVPGDEIYPPAPGANGATATMMDRNLGAPPHVGVWYDQQFVAHPQSGTYYQRGNKNPFLNSDYQGVGGTSGAWSGSGKSITDPCPPGYRIPSSDVWIDPKRWNQETTIFDGSFLYWQDFIQIGDVSTERIIRYPFSSYIKEDKTKAEFRIQTHESRDSAPRTGSDTYNLLLATASYEYRIVLHYGGTTEYQEAYVHAEDKPIFFEYDYYEVDSGTLKYSVYGKVVVKPRWGDTKTYTIDKKNVTQEELKNYQVPGINVSLGSLIDVDAIATQLFSTLKNEVNSRSIDKLSYGDEEGQMKNSYGLQVRCVKE